MDALTAAREAHRATDPYDRLCRRVRADGRVSVSRITREVIRDTPTRLAAIDAAVKAGVVAIEVIETGAHPRLDLVWVG